MSHGDSRGDVQTLGKDLHTIDFSIAIGVAEDLDAVFTWPWFMTRIFETLRDIDASGIIEGHSDWVLDIWFRCDQLDVEALGNNHSGQGF